jgi:hypothetical protein
MLVKPGDLIEWMYHRDGRPVREDRLLWSTVEKKWVPIGSELTHLCVSCEGEIITWLNERGVFRARMDHAGLVHQQYPWQPVVVPRPRG